ncbi:hypothetical protein BGX27_004633 [Mortierella sp. AM989]|nr:hypothetical protein BGX27_004633 [Mortierella sp. AM989]
MMVPDPMCPHCHDEFVEKIESDNDDPRTFIQSNQQNETDEDGEHGPGSEEPLNIDDLFRLFQAISSSHSSVQHRQQQQQRPPSSPQQQRQRPEQMFGGGTSIIFSTEPMGSRTIFTSSPGASSSEGQTESTSERARQDGQQQGPQWHGPPSFVSGLLNRLGIDVRFTTDPAAFQGGGFGGEGMGGGGFFPVVGNPGDYAWGQGGLDDIITRMMELQNRQNGPVGASDEIIDSIPRHKLTIEEKEANTECSVCKDEFTMEDTLLQLPCKHVFHEDCIKPWLKVSGTCPTCRFSLVSGNNDSGRSGDNSSGSGAGNASASSGPGSSTRIPGSFPSSPNPNSRGGNDGNQGGDGYPAMEALD